MERDKRGFTLAELLVVVAIIAVLVAIAIPIFTSQLEKSREATDAANIRSQYAQVMTDAITEGGNVNGKSAYGEIDLKQKEDNWQDETLGDNLESLFSGHIVGEFPKANGTAWVEYDASDSKVILHYEGEGSGNGGSSSGGNTGGTSGGDTSGSSTSFTCPDFTIDNVVPLIIEKKDFSVSKGTVYSYQGNFYVCIADYNASKDWSDFSSITPNGNKWPYIQLVNNPKVITDADTDNNNGYSDPYFDGVNLGTVYKSSNNDLYIMTVDNPKGSWVNPPGKNMGNWVKID